MLHTKFISLLCDHFDKNLSEPVYNGMAKLDVDRTHPDMIQVIGHYCPQGYEFSRGNFFLHSHPYYPHVDGYEDELNVLLPLRKLSIYAQTFVVFNQTFPRPATWSKDPKLGEFKINKLRKMSPADDYEVKGLTELPCPLVHQLPGVADFWFGLSGSVYLWTPGAVIMFPSNHIHATGRQLGEKLGLTLVYKRS